MVLNSETKNISIPLNEDEAIVLFEWLAKFNITDNTTFFQDQAEQRVLFNLEAILEKNIPSMFSDEYKTTLLKARERLRDKE